MSRRPRGFLSPEEAAELCGVGRTKVLSWLDAGMLRHQVTGSGRRRVLREDLAAFLDERGLPIPDELDPGPLRVAIVDDDEPFARSMARLVRRDHPDAEVREARDGFAAGLLLSSFRPHVVLLDQVMPGIGGDGVLLRLRQYRELDATRVVVVSGHVTGAEEERFVQLGAAAVVRKPPDPDQLRAVLAECVPPHRRRRS